MDYLIAYDIEDNKNRSKVFEMLKDFGLRAVQKSVFFGELSNAEKIEIKIFLSENSQDIFNENYTSNILLYCPYKKQNIFIFMKSRIYLSL